MAKRFALVAFVGLASLTLVACGGDRTTESVATGGETTSNVASEPMGESTGSTTVTMAMTSAWSGLQPYNVVGLYSTVIFDQVYDRLTYLTEDMEYEPRLATDWEMADDFRSITFHLNENAKWHDGQPVTADDVAFTIRVMTNVDTKVANRSAFLSIAGTNAVGIADDPNALGVETLDPHTVRLHLKEPMEEGAFLNAFARVFFVFPEHILGDVSPSELEKDPFWKEPIGSGPFKFVTEVEGQFVELARNEDYFMGSPSIEKLIIKVLPQTSIAAGLKTGDIDLIAGFGMGDVPLQDWEMVKEMDHIQSESVPTLTTQFLTINTEKPYLSDPRIRRALWMAMNRQALVDHLYRGEGVVARGPYGPSHPYFNSNLPEIPYDPDAAKALLDEASWDPGQQLVLTVPTGNVQRERSGALIQQDFNNVGVNVQVQQVDFTTSLNQVREGDYDLALFGSPGSPDPDLTNLMHPSGAMNLSQQRIPAIMTPIEEGLKGLTFEERKAYYDDLQVQLQKHAPYVYMYHDNARMALNKRLSNVPYGDFMWQNYGAWKWEVQ